MSGLSVQIVNDTGLADSDVFLLLTGDTVSTTGQGIVTLQLPQPGDTSVTAGAVNLLSTSTSIVSTQTGNTCPVYSFDVSALTSGRLLVSLGTAIVYANNSAPTATGEAMRWDKLEFGYPDSGADLTALDFFGIPMQFEFLDAGGNVLSTNTYYTSTLTLLTSLFELQPSTMASAFQYDNAGEPTFGWNPTTDSLGSFLRVIGPQTFTGTGTGSPAPYPSFATYLQALATSGQQVTISGSGGVGDPAPQPNTVDYVYSGSFASATGGGYMLALTGQMTIPPENPPAEQCYGLYVDAGQTAYAELPASLPITVCFPAGALDNNIYAAVPGSFSVACELTTDQLLAVTNSPYANIAGDVLAGLNFGYVGGVWGEDSAGWYSNPPTPYPFGAARATNDGFYNPYAAVFYNQSDAYGFPFSDRGGRPNPYVSQPSNATTLRITIMSDNRIDAPRVGITQRETSLFTLTWPVPAVPSGVTLTGYLLQVTPPFPAWESTLAADSTTVTVGALPLGTQYTFALTALGTAANGKPVQSFTTTVTGSTGVTATPLTGDFTFLTTLNWSAAAAQPSGATFIINGATYIPPAGEPVSISGTASTNTYPLTILDAGNTPIYQGNYVVSLTADGGGQYSIDPSGFYMLDCNSQPLTRAGGSNTHSYSSTPPDQLSVGTPFAPIPGKQANPVAFP